MLSLWVTMGGGAVATSPSVWGGDCRLTTPPTCSQGPAHPLILPGCWAAGREDKEELDSQLLFLQEAILISLAALQPGLTQAGSQTT